MQSASTSKLGTGSWSGAGARESPSNVKSSKQTRGSESRGTSGGANGQGSGSATVFQCSGFGDCRMVFTRSEHLARHVRFVLVFEWHADLPSKHTGERPFQCHCFKAFSRLDNLRQHCQTVHSDTPERNEEVLRKLTVLHSNLAASAAKNQRTFARVSIPNSNANNEEKNTKDKSEGGKKRVNTATSPTGSVAVSSLLSVPEPSKYTGNDEQHTDRGDLSSEPKDAKQPVPVVYSSPSSQSEPTNSSTLPAWSNKSSSNVSNATNPPGASIPSPVGVSNKGFADTPFMGEGKTSSILPPVSEISTKLRPSAFLHDQRPYTSRSLPVAIKERDSLPLNDQRRASLPVPNPSLCYATTPGDIGSSAYYLPGASRVSYLPTFGAGKYSPKVQSDLRWTESNVKRSSGFASSAPAGGPKRSFLTMSKSPMPEKFNDSFPGQGFLLVRCFMI